MEAQTSKRRFRDVLEEFDQDSTGGIEAFAMQIGQQPERLMYWLQLARDRRQLPGDGNDC